MAVLAMFGTETILQRRFPSRASPSRAPGFPSANEAFAVFDIWASSGECHAPVRGRRSSMAAPDLGDEATLKRLQAGAVFDALPDSGFPVSNGRQAETYLPPIEFVPTFWAGDHGTFADQLGVHQKLRHLQHRTAHPVGIRPVWATGSPPCVRKRQTRLCPPDPRHPG